MTIIKGAELELKRQISLWCKESGQLLEQLTKLSEFIYIEMLNFKED